MSGPWRTVQAATEVEGRNKGWRWRITLDCLHRTTQPCRTRRVKGRPRTVREHIPPPKRMRCAQCWALRLNEKFSGVGGSP